MRSVSVAFSAAAGDAKLAAMSAARIVNRWRGLTSSPVVLLLRGLGTARRRRPAIGGGVVGLPRLDPMGALGALLRLPKRRARLEVVHEKLGGRERVVPVRGRGDDQHDVLARRDAAVAVDDGDA